MTVKAGVDLETFERGIREFTKNLLEVEIVLFQKKIVFTVLEGVVFATPVDTGNARGGWQVTIGAEPQTETTRLDPSGQATFEAGIAALGSLTPFQIVYIGNLVAYIEALNDGHSSQAPANFIELALERAFNTFPS